MTVLLTSDTVLPSPQVLELSFSFPTNSPRLFHPIHASLSNGSLAESTFVFVNPLAAERDLPRSLYLTTPYPIRPGSDALFGAVLANGGEEIVVDHLDFEIPGGYDLRHHNGTGVPLFAKEFNITDANGGYWTRLDDRHIRWHGPREVAARSATFWSVPVPVTDDVNHFTAVEPPSSSGPTSTLSFDNGFSTTSTRWGPVPGVIQHRVPPASSGEPGAPADGYPWSAAELGTGAERSFRGDVMSVRAHLENTSSYRLAAQSSDLQRLQSSVANSSLSVESRLVPIGSYAHVEGHLESLLTTVSSMGATDMTLTLDMYSPVSRGCAPTTSATVAVSGLPAERVSNSLIWDGGTGIPSVFATTDDGVVHRVGPDGTPLWSHELEAQPTHLAKGDFGAAGLFLFAADVEGKLHALDPATGEVQWATTLAAGNLAGRAPGLVTSLTVNATTARLLVTTTNGFLEILDAAVGSSLRLYQSPQAISSAAYGADGTVYALGTTNVTSYDAELRLAAEDASTPRGLALAVGKHHILVAVNSEVRLLDPMTLEVVDTLHLGGAIRMAAVGDVTGDGVEDVATILATNWIAVVSGATGDLAWERDISTGSLGKVEERFEWDGPSLLVFRDREAQMTCPDAPARYGAPPTCFSDLDASKPVALEASRGRVSFILDAQGFPWMTTLGPNGVLVAEVALEPLRSYTHLTHGEWVGAEAISLGDADGRLSLRATHPPEILMQSSPSDRLGSFSWYIPTPKGGFFGTHLVIATLRWTDASSFEQEARLVEWFEVVAPDGKPVTNPAYRVVLVVQDRGDPLT